MSDCDRDSLKHFQKFTKYFLFDVLTCFHNMQGAFRNHLLMIGKPEKKSRAKITLDSVEHNKGCTAQQFLPKLRREVAESTVVEVPLFHFVVFQTSAEAARQVVEVELYLKMKCDANKFLIKSS